MNFFLLLLLCFCSYVYAEFLQELDHCKQALNTIITAYDPYKPYAHHIHNIPLEPHTFPLWIGAPSPAIMNLAEQWIHNNTELLEQLLTTPKPLSTALVQHTDNLQTLQEQNIINLSTSNYVLALGDSPHYIKISGPTHRLINLMVGAGYEYLLNSKALNIDLEQIRSIITRSGMPTFIDHIRPTTTYQTISQYAYYLMAQEACLTYTLNYITIPHTEIVHVRPGPISDETCIIVQEKITFDASPELLSEAVIQLIVLIVATGLWDIKDHNIIRHAQGISIIDLEQPNRRSPQEFLHKNPFKTMVNIIAGLEGLGALLDKPQWQQQFKQVGLLIEYFLEHESLFAQCFKQHFGKQLKSAFKLA